MTDTPERPVLGRPPVEGTEEELDVWVEGMLCAILGPEECSVRDIRSTSEADEQSA